MSLLGWSDYIFFLLFVLDRKSLGLILDLSHVGNFLGTGSGLWNNGLGWLCLLRKGLGFILCLGIKVFNWLGSTDSLGSHRHGSKDYFLK